MVDLKKVTKPTPKPKKAKKKAAPKAKGKKGFQKGVSGNPNGRPKLPVEIREAAKLTHIDLVTQISELWTTDVSDLMEIVKTAMADPRKLTDPAEIAAAGKVPAGRAMLASAILFAIRQGDYKRIDALLNRVVGRPAETIKLMGAFEGKIQHDIPVEQILANPEMAERAYELANFVSGKMLSSAKDVSPPETGPTAAEIVEVIEGS